MPKIVKSTLSGKTSVAWPPFTEELEHALGTLQEDQYLVISVKRSGHYVQFAGQGSYGLRVETTSNAYLGDGDKLDKRQLSALAKAGWSKPTRNPQKSTPENDPDGSPNYFAEFPAPVDLKAVSKLSVRTMVKILRVPHPGMLEYEAFDSDSNPIDIPGLGLKRLHRARNGTSQSDTQAIVSNLLASLRKVTGIADLAVDGDGDIGTRYGSVITFARVIGEPPVVHLYCPLVSGVSESPEVFERLNTINGHTQQVRFFWRNESIYAVAEIPAVPYTEEHVQETYKQFCRVADDMDDLLQADFGGRTAFFERAPSAARH
jgi:hypothetical protein